MFIYIYWIKRNAERNVHPIKMGLFKAFGANYASPTKDTMMLRLFTHPYQL